MSRQTKSRDYISLPKGQEKDERVQEAEMNLVLARSPLGLQRK